MPNDLDKEIDEARVVFPLDKPSVPFIRCPLTRDCGVTVNMHGEASVPALDRLIELLVLTRNCWAGFEP